MPKYLTERAVESAKPNSTKRLEIADAGLQGLYLVIQPSGARSWALRYRHNGRPRKATLGAYPRIGLKEARKRARDALDTLELGRDPGAEQIASKRRQHAPGLDRDAFAVQARVYLTRHAMKTKTWKETARHLGLRPDPAMPGSFVEIPGGLAARWAELPVHSITRRMIIQAIDEPVDRGAPIAANRQLAVLARVFNWLVARDVLRASPTTGVKKPSAERSRDRILADGELARVWAAACSMGYPFGDLVRVLLLTGQRREEVAAAVWTEFNLETALWQIPGARTKNGRPHLVQLSGPVLDVLAKVPRFAGGPYIFGHAGRAPFQGFSRAKRNLDRYADLAPWMLHDLRRTCATGMAALGVPPHIVESVLNHISGARAGVAGVYNRAVHDVERREALERWASHVERQTKSDDVIETVVMRRDRCPRTISNENCELGFSRSSQRKKISKSF